MRLTVKAHAKINWLLLVRGKRPDGYHEITSLMQRVTLSDTLTMEPDEGISVRTEAAIPEKENLVYKAAMGLKALAGPLHRNKGVRITLTKRIPSPGGLGGGSSDAASTLSGLINLWRVRMDDAELYKLAASLGSDVPFFLGAGAALASGRGEVLEPLSKGPRFALLLAKPPVSVPTPWAYAHITRYTATPLDKQALIEAINSGDAAQLARFMQNDLEEPVFAGFPEVRELKERISGLGALATMMSGSGPTVFGIFPSLEDAAKAARALPPGIWAEPVETL